MIKKTDILLITENVLIRHGNIRERINSDGAEKWMLEVGDRSAERPFSLSRFINGFKIAAERKLTSPRGCY